MALQKFYIKNVIFRPHWLKPFSNWSNYNAKPSRSTKWHQISMWCFHFYKQRFPCIFLKKAPTKHKGLCSTIYLVHTWLPSYQFTMIPSLSYHNTYFSWREFWRVTIQNGSGIPVCVWWLQRMISYLRCFLFDALLIY